MDPQQEMFSALLVALKEKYEGTGIGVYDTILPPKETPYPFVYMDECEENDQSTKNGTIGEIHQTIKVWHDNPKQRGTVSKILSEIKGICSSTEHTEHYAWIMQRPVQRIVPDSSTKQPLLMGILDVSFKYS